MNWHDELPGGRDCRVELFLAMAILAIAFWAREIVAHEEQMQDSCRLLAAHTKLPKPVTLRCK